jgi:molybdenum cofactor synthesis domain-containing protein
MIPTSKALSIINRETGSLGVETIRLTNLVGRILAEDIVADTDMPPFNRSQMDGYAMRAKDSTNAPVTLKLVGESAAGHGWNGTLRSGEAIRIMTGARVPAGADSVQKIELTNEADDTVTIEEPTEKGRYIVRKAAEIKKGARLFRSGSIVTERMVASLAAFGYARVKVAEQPTVSILATGSEIVAIEKRPGRDQIRNSNSVMLRALCESVGARVKVLRPAGDDLSKLKRTIAKAADSDLLVITGGVSVGKYVLTKAALRELGASIFFEKVRLKPGKPTVFGRLDRTLVFGLPGNPVSAAVTFYLFVRASILKMQTAAKTDLRAGFAVLTSDAKAAKERDTYLPATIATDERGRLLATPLRWHGSSDFVGFACADALVFIPKGESIPGGNIAGIFVL